MPSLIYNSQYNNNIRFDFNYFLHLVNHVGSGATNTVIVCTQVAR